jgi:acyl-CoA thioesterase FadM
VVVLLRVIFHAVRALFRRRIAPTNASAIRLRVWPNDIDINLHMNNGRYLSLMDLGRMDLIARIGVLRPAIRRGWLPVLGNVAIRFRRQLEPFESFTLRSRILCWDAKWFYMEQVFEKRDGDVAATALVRGVLRAKTGVIAPPDVLALISAPPESPAVPDAVAKWMAMLA